MKRTAPILAFIALLTVYHTVGAIWGRTAKLYVLVGMLGLYAALGLALFIMRRRLRREQPELAVELETDARVPWYWRLLDGVLGVSFALGPAFLVSLVRRQPLSLEAEFTGCHLLAMAGGVGVFLLSRAYVVRCYQKGHRVTNDAT